MADKNPAFAVKPDDPKDVSWGLTTADACWKRGERSEALKWLRRAVEAASEAEHDERALELAKVAADLATQIGSMVPPRPEPVTAPVAVPRVPAIAPKPAAAKGPTPPVSAVTAKNPVVKETPKKADRKSITNEAGPRSRAGHAAPEKAHEASHAKAHDDKEKPAELPPPRKRANSRADRTEKERRQSRTDEIDQWPTDVVSGDDLPASLSGPDVGTTTDLSFGAVKGKPVVRAAQAVRALVWKAPDGSVRVAVAGSGKAAPFDAVEVTLVAAEATADLVALLS